VKEIDGQTYVDEKELEAFRAYLNAPWPHEKGKRPAIPEAIKEDIRQESHYECAICGNANNGEIAHIEAVADTLNNGPDNLLFLCPNHHTQYDLGFKPTNNITAETVKAAKLMKRAARVRTQRFEANTTKFLHSVINALKTLKKQVSGTTDRELISAYETETRQLMESLPDLLKECEIAAHKDSESDSVEKLAQKIAPSIVKHTRGVSKETKPMQLRTAADSLISSIDEALLDLDEVDCPHCGGSGLTGLVGDFCAFCKGDMVVTKEDAKAYDPAEIDEVPCPHCHAGGDDRFGRGYLRVLQRFVCRNGGNGAGVRSQRY
jgi:DNA-directed RNA polymerase subunit RPC12/RpoP